IRNKAPVLKMDGDKSRVAQVGQPVTLPATATDDGKPRARSIPAALARIQQGTPNSATGLRLSWFVLRGSGKVTFNPPQTEVWEDSRENRNSPWSIGWRVPQVPPDGKWVNTITFSEP